MNSKYMDAVVATGNIGVGMGVAATQLGLIVGAAATNLVLDCIIATKNAGKGALNKGISFQKAIEQRIYNAIGLTQELAKNPTERITEHANTFLDIANSVAGTIFGLQPASENPESNFRERISFLAERIAVGVSNRANEFVIDPLYQQINSVVEQLGKCFFMVDYLKQRKEWTYNKVNQLSTSMVELRNKLEVEAKRAKTSPGDVLLSIIRHYSSKLNEQLGKLRERGAELLSPTMQKQIQAATKYVEELDDTFSKAKNIDEVKTEVIKEAKEKLNDITQWPATLIKNQQSANKQNGMNMQNH